MSRAPPAIRALRILLVLLATACNRASLVDNLDAAALPDARFECSAPCGAGMVCAGGECVAGQCNGSEDCPGRWPCVRHRCVPCGAAPIETPDGGVGLGQGCCSTIDCGAGLVCRAAQGGTMGQCGDCADDLACGGGARCCGGRCFDGTCCEHADCLGLRCVAHRCVPCGDDGQCEQGQRCCRGVCQAGVCCRNADCAPGEACKANQCGACAIADDCDAGRVCCGGACVAGACCADADCPGGRCVDHGCVS